MPFADYDLCIITQERFSSDTNSNMCPVVGECGHSFTKQGIQNWYEGRKTDEYHKRKSYVPCAYKCARKWVNKKGQRMEEQMRAFKASNLVPNFALCVAIDAIKGVKLGKAEKANEEFVRCSLCQNDYSTAPAPAGFEQNPRAPMVGLCGHTFCASCIYDKHQQAMQDSNCDSLRYVQCPHCQEKGAFHTDRLVLNLGLKDALMHWEEIGVSVDYKDLYRKEKAKCNTLKELHDEEMEIQKDLYKKKNDEYEEMKFLRKREAEALIKCSKLYKKKAAEYDDLKVFHEKAMKAQRDFLGKKATKYEALKVLYERQIEAQIKSRELYKKLASEHKDLLKRRAEYDALMVKHKEMEAQIMYKDLYEKKIVEYEALKVVCNNMSRQCEALTIQHQRAMVDQTAYYKVLFEKKTSEHNALKAAYSNEMQITTNISKTKMGEYDNLMRLFKKKTEECKALKVLHVKELEAKLNYIYLYHKKTAEYDALRGLGDIGQLSMEDAHAYLNDVEQAFGDDHPELYKEFLTVLEALFHKKDISGLVERVCKILCGHNNLILGFNKFLPDHHKIKLADVERIEETSQPSGRNMSLEETDDDNEQSVNDEEGGAINKKGNVRGASTYKNGDKIFLSPNKKGLRCSVSSDLAGKSAIVLDYKIVGSWMTVQLTEGSRETVRIRKVDATKDATNVQYSTNTKDSHHSDKVRVLGPAKKKQKLCLQLTDNPSAAKLGSPPTISGRSEGLHEVAHQSSFTPAADDKSEGNKKEPPPASPLSTTKKNEIFASVYNDTERNKEVYRGPPMDALAGDQTWPDGWVNDVTISD